MFLMFRYNTQSKQLRVFKITPDDRDIQAKCAGKNHEFAVSSNFCAGGHISLGPLLRDHTIDPTLRNKFKLGENWKVKESKDFEE